MRLFILLFAFVLVSWSAPSGYVLANDAPPPSKSEESISDETISALIQQLADPSTAKRDDAAKQLIEIGTPAKAQIEAASKNDTGLIGRRAKAILLSITRRERALNWEAFIQGKSATPPPAWEKFKKVAGDTPETRKFYIEIYRAEPKLMEAYANNLSKATAFVTRYSITQKFSPQKLANVNIIAACLLVAGDKNAKLSDETIIWLFNMMAFDFPTAPFAAALASGPKSKPLRQLVGRWINKKKYGPETATMDVLTAAYQYEFPEGLSLACEVLERESADKDFWGLTQAVAIMVIGRLGNENHVKLLEPLLRRSDALNLTEDSNLQLRDFALAAVVHLTGQSMEHYGIGKIDSFNFPMGQFPLKGIFTNSGKRKQALSKWAVWRKQHRDLTRDTPAAAKENNSTS